MKPPERACRFITSNMAYYRHMDRKPCVVLIEDDDVLADLLVKRLTLQSIDSVHYANGSDAVSGIPLLPHVDLILLDISLPDMDGFEVLKKLTPFQTTAQIPVIIVSNFSQEADIAWGKKLGVKQFINKVSVSPIEIVDIVSKYTR